MKQKLIIAAILGITSIVANAEFSDKYDFNFEMTSPKSMSGFAPTQVFTDGQKTWIQVKNSQVSPSIFSDEKPLSFVSEFPYIILKGVYNNLDVVIAGENVAHIEYNGRYANKAVGSSFSVAKPIAINATAPLPVPHIKTENDEVKRFVRLDHKIEGTISEITIDKVVSLPVSKVTNNRAVNKESEVTGSLTIEPAKGAFKKSQASVESDKSIFVAWKKSPSKDTVKSIKNWVEEGNSITLKGFSGKSDDVARGKSAMKRCKELSRMLVKAGVPIDAISIDESVPEDKSKSGASVFFNLGV